MRRSRIARAMRLVLWCAVLSAPVAAGWVLWRGATTEDLAAVEWQAEQNTERIEELEEGIAALELEVSFLKALYVQGCGAK